ncbi:MAG: hypothetical protein IT160_09545 [Bryobacterales bacterium]|nr:hypothetical protein [Bryobacterales bacterium]
MDLEYRYDTTGHNNGQIGSMKGWVSGTTNRITTYGFGYNANGTMAAMPNWQGTYDKESRLVDVTQSQNAVASHTKKIIVTPCAGKRHARFERGN